MNREILFRGKRTDDGQWVESNSIKQLNPNEIFLLGGRCWIEVVPGTVGQYTGLTNKNGVKIFEGDIVVWDYNAPDIDGSTHTTPEVVKWNEKYCGFANVDGVCYDNECRIIGNVYDNPELLKGEENVKGSKI